MRRILLIIAALVLTIPLSAQNTVTTVPHITSTLAHQPFVLFTSTTAGSNVDTSETNLITYSLPANTLRVNRQGLRITIVGGTAANGNTKTIKAYFGTTNTTSFSSTYNAQDWKIVIEVWRTGAATQIASSARFIAGGLGIAASAPTETLSGAITIRVTGQSGTASADVTARAMSVEWLPVGTSQ